MERLEKFLNRVFLSLRAKTRLMPAKTPSLKRGKVSFSTKPPTYAIKLNLYNKKSSNFKKKDAG